MLSLRAYAARIRELELSCGVFQYDGIVTLARWFPPDVPILPQLRRLYWGLDEDCCKTPLNTTTKVLNSGNLGHISLFLCDPLCRYPASIINDIYRILTEPYSFSLYFSTGEYVIDDESSIWRLSHLKSLEVDGEFTVTRPILISLSELSLKSLTLNNFSTFIPSQSPRLHFSSLLNLSLTTAVYGVVDVMRSISLPNATDIFLNINISADQSLMQKDLASFHAIYSAFPTSLRRLRVEVDYSIVKREETAWLGPNALNFDAFVRPLQSLHHLEELTLSVELMHCVRGFLELRNGDLRSLIPSWPGLSLFSYGVSPLAFPRPLQCDDPTLDTIFAFARAHPRLVHLCLPCVRTNTLPDDPPLLEDAERPLQGHGLLQLNVRMSSGAPKDGAYLAPIVRAVDRAFPQMYKEIRRSHALNKYLPWGFLEEELYALHAEDEVYGG